VEALTARSRANLNHEQVLGPATTQRVSGKYNAFLGKTERCKGINRRKKATLLFPSSLSDISEEKQSWTDTDDNN